MRVCKVDLYRSTATQHGTFASLWIGYNSVDRWLIFYSDLTLLSDPLISYKIASDLMCHFLGAMRAGNYVLLSLDACSAWEVHVKESSVTWHYMDYQCQESDSAVGVTVEFAQNEDAARFGKEVAALQGQKCAC